MGGIAAFKLLKAADPVPRVILMTAHTDLMEEAEREGAWRVLPKPLNIAGLLELLQ